MEKISQQSRDNYRLKVKKPAVCNMSIDKPSYSRKNQVIRLSFARNDKYKNPNEYRLLLCNFFTHKTW